MKRSLQLSRLVQQPPVKHEVKMKDFVSWLGRLSANSRSFAHTGVPGSAVTMRSDILTQHNDDWKWLT
jgi:hypothetical protein